MVHFPVMAHALEHAGFERILEFLRQARGFDFTAYKRTSLMRRVRKRMQMVEVAEFEAYLDFLQVHPDEFVSLFNTILINVTSFFRDPEVWDALRTSVVPELVAARNGNGPIRVWSAGSASGQEAYSAAMILAEVLGAEAFRERVKIYATASTKKRSRSRGAPSITRSRSATSRPICSRSTSIAAATISIRSTATCVGP